MKKILLCGKTGFIGKHLYESLEKIYQIDAPDRHELDITNQNLVKKYLSEKQYDVVILAAGSKDIKKLEKEPEFAYNTNTKPVEYFSKYIQNSKLLFFSTDYVFDGKQGYYKDTDTPSPTTVYGKTKQKAEEILLNTNTDFTIIRCAAVLGKGSVFLDWLLKSLKEEPGLDMFENQFFTPTPVNFLCKITENIIEHGCENKILHAVGNQRMSRFEIAEIIRKQTGSRCKINPVKSEYKDYSLIQSKYVKRLQNKSVEEYLKEELENV